MKKVIIVFLIIVTSFTSIFASQDRPTVAVVLSGGGAKGIAHIALFEKLEELGIPVDCVLGTSMGALMGGLYSAGYTPKEIRKLIKDNNLAELFTEFVSSGYKELVEPFQFTRDQISISLENGIVGISGFIDDYKIMNFFYDALGNVPADIDFDKLPIKFRCIGTNAVTGRRKIFDKGSIVDSMRASMSIPFAFEPKEIDGELYVDGGLVDNMPIDLAREMGYDIIIAEDVNAQFSISKDQYKTMSGGFSALFRVVVNNTIRDQKINADVLFTPNLKGIGTLDFADPDKIIARGEDEMRLKVDDLRYLASLFTEEQKEYKDPDRTGDYFQYFQDQAVIYKKSTAKTKQQSAFSQTRFSFGIEFPVYYTFSIKNKELNRFSLNPSLNLKLYTTNLIGDKVSGDFRLNVGRNIIAKPKLLFEFRRGVGKQSIFGILCGDVNFGSQSNLTDRDNLVSYNRTEYKLGVSTGLKITDEQTKNINILLKGDFYYLQQSLLEDNSDAERFKYLYPRVELSGVWFDLLQNKELKSDGLRIDAHGQFGVVKSKITYRASIAAENKFELGKKDSLKVQLQAATSREPKLLRDSYYTYGGKNGIPGYLPSDYFSDFLSARLTYQHYFNTGSLSRYLSVKVGYGLRSGVSDYNYDFALIKANYEWFSEQKIANSMAPFKECFGGNGAWDLGAAIALGLESDFGTYEVGIGMNKDLKTSIYIEF